MNGKIFNELKAKYNSIGIDYNITRKADPYLTESLYHHLNTKPNKLYLDIGCGTGNYTAALHKKGVKFIGIDPSNEMLNKAKLNNSDIIWKLGTAENIPIENESVFGCIASLTIHHWHNLNVSFNEINRVLIPNEKLVIFTSTPSQMKGYWLNYYFPKMLQDSIEQMPTLETIKEHLSKNGFKNIKTEMYSIEPDLQDLFLYAGKNNPELYLNSQVRHGISSFSSLANKNEVEKGLTQLENDIKSGKINQIINDYKNDKGDYLFIIANK